MGGGGSEDFSRLFSDFWGFGPETPPPRPGRSQLKSPDNPYLNSPHLQVWGENLPPNVGEGGGVSKVPGPKDPPKDSCYWSGGGRNVCAGEGPTPRWSDRQLRHQVPDLWALVARSQHLSGTVPSFPKLLHLVVIS